MSASYLSVLPGEVRHIVYNYGAYMISWETTQAQAEALRWKKKAEDTPANDEKLCMRMSELWQNKAKRSTIAQTHFMNYFVMLYPHVRQAI